MNTSPLTVNYGLAIGLYTKTSHDGGVILYAVAPDQSWFNIHHPTVDTEALGLTIEELDNGLSQITLASGEVYTIEHQRVTGYTTNFGVSPLIPTIVDRYFIRDYLNPAYGPEESIIPTEEELMDAAALPPSLEKVTMVNDTYNLWKWLREGKKGNGFDTVRYITDGFDKYPNVKGLCFDDGNVHAEDGWSWYSSLPKRKKAWFSNKPDNDGKSLLVKRTVLLIRDAGYELTANPELRMQDYEQLFNDTPVMDIIKGEENPDLTALIKEVTTIIDSQRALYDDWFTLELVNLKHRDIIKRKKHKFSKGIKGKYFGQVPSDAAQWSSPDDDPHFIVITPEGDEVVTTAKDFTSKNNEWLMTVREYKEKELDTTVIAINNQRGSASIYGYVR